MPRHVWSALSIVCTLAIVLVIQVVPYAGAQAAPTYTWTGSAFLDTFDTTSSAPDPFRPGGWDVTTIRHPDDSIDPMWAEHGPACEAPDNLWTPNTEPNHATNHWITQSTQSAYLCSGHIMTAMNAGYGAVYLTPPAMMDFSAGTSVLEWDMSTQRTSSRDWVDFVLMPFEPSSSTLPKPMAINLIDAHTPASALWIELVGGGNVFMPHKLTTTEPASSCGAGSFVKQPSGVVDCRMSFDGYHTWDMKLAENGLQTSAQRRDHFRIEVSQTHLKVGFRPTASGPYFYWVDTDIPGGGVPFNKAIVQLNQRTYNPLKPCGIGVGDPGWPNTGWEEDCRAGTWHWDNVAINPAIPITIMPGPRRVDGSATVTFESPAPADSFIKTAGNWDATYSVNGGTTWQAMPEVGPRLGEENGISYWAPVPQGVQTVMFQGVLQDVYLYSRGTVAGGTPTPTPTPLPPTNTPTPTPTPGGPTATPTPTPVPPTATPTPTPGALTTITFDETGGVWPPVGTMSGTRPAGVINWGTNQWYYSGPYAQFTTNSFGFNGPSITTTSFNFVTAKILVSVKADNGASTGSTNVSLACSGNTTLNVTIPAHTVQTLTSGWTTPCTTVTVSSSNGWDTNFDDLVYQ